MAEQNNEQGNTPAEPSRAEVIKSLGEAFTSGKGLPTNESTDDDEARRRRADAQPNGAQADAPGTGSAGGPGADAGTVADGAGAVRPAAPEPFAGFSELKPEQQAMFNTLLGERNQYRDRFASLQGRIPRLQSQIDSLQRAGTVTPKQAADLKLWADHTQRFPDEAAAVDERVQALIDQAVAPLRETNAQLQQRLAAQDSVAQTREVAEHVDKLDREHPAWRQVAGWVDDQGKPVPQAQQKWHPWFNAWMDQQPPSLQGRYRDFLEQPDADLIGHVMSHFERDVQSYISASGQGRPDAAANTAGNATSARRTEALNDATPRPARNGSVVNNPLSLTPGSDTAERSAVIGRFYEDFKAGKLFPNK